MTNCSNNYGPYQFPEKLIPLMTLNALEGRELPIYGDGMNVRDWLFVEDHCEGILLALERGVVGESYNIGGAAEKPNVEVVDAICDALQAIVPAESNPALTTRGLSHYRELKSFVPDRLGHDRRYAIDAGKIRSELGWKPRHDFASGIEATVRWYVENRKWCRAVQLKGRYDRSRLGRTDDSAGGAEGDA
jgi:dTDP-glucose 4,6-dehydratase